MNDDNGRRKRQEYAASLDLILRNHAGSLQDPSDRTRIASAYERIFRTAAAGQSDNRVDWTIAFRYLPSSRSAVCLDVGCGTGRFAQAVASLGYERVVGCDLITRIEASGVIYLRASMDQLPFAGESVDYVSALSCLYYTREPAIALAEAARVLKPGGVLVMTAPTRLSLFGIHRRLVRRLGMSGWDHLAGAQFIDVSTWRRMAHAAGFATTHVDGFVVSFVLRLLWRRLQSALGQLGIALREWRDREGRSSLAREIRAHIAYHAILVLEKRDSSSA